MSDMSLPLDVLKDYLYREKQEQERNSGRLSTLKAQIRKVEAELLESSSKIDNFENAIARLNQA